MSEREHDEACKVCRTVQGLRELGAASVKRKREITDRQIKISNLHKAISYLANNAIGIRENPFAKNCRDILYSALKYQCRIKELEREIQDLQTSNAT